MKKPRLVAHRGASHEHPENTLAAFRAAWAQGVEAVELDVRVSKDGHVVVLHDADTRRVGGVDRAVADQTLAELQAIDVGAGERIPTLADALATVPDGHTLFVEIKSGEDTVATVARTIMETKHRARIALQSFDTGTLADLRDALPGSTAYWTVRPPRDERDQLLPYPTSVIDDAARDRFDGVALLYEATSDELLAAARAKNILVDVWTVNDATLLAAWLAKDVRWVETDRPELVR